MAGIKTVPSAVAQLIQRFAGLEAATRLSQANARLWGELRITPTHEGLRLYFPRGLVCWVYVEDSWLPGIPLNTTRPYEPTEPYKPYEPTRNLKPGIIFTCVRPDGENVGKNVPYIEFGKLVSVNPVEPNTRPKYSIPAALNLCTPYGVLPNLLDAEGFYLGSDKKYQSPESYLVAKLPNVLGNSVGSRISIEEYIVNVPLPTVPYDIRGKTDKNIAGRLMTACRVHRKASNLAKFMSREALQCLWLWEWDCGCQWMDPRR
jgi:hypothetical protein